MCGSDRLRPTDDSRAVATFTADDLRITDHAYGKTLPLLECERCGFLFADPALARELEALYEELEDPDYEATEDARRTQLRGLLERAVERLPRRPRTLLDVGAATGLLAESARDMGLDALGVEPSESLAAYAQGKGRPVERGIWPLPGQEDRRFDVVTLIDVVEHVSDPVALLRAAGSALAEGGTLVVVTPDLSSLAAQTLGRRWWHFRMAHVGYFTPGTFSWAAKEAGLTVFDQWWASWRFPVGYLSERLTEYLPVGPIHRLVAATPGLRRVHDLEIPVQLFDSRVFLLRGGA